MKIDKFLNTSPLFHSSLLFEQVVTPFQLKLKSIGLTIRQSLILTAIYFEEEKVTPTELAKTLHTSPSNISHALNYLESKRWIQRTQYPGNRKKLLVSLTAFGEKKALKLIPIYNSFQDDLEKHYSESVLLAWNKKSKGIIDISSKIIEKLNL